MDRSPLYSGLCRAARLDPEACALVIDGQEYRYAELVARVNRCAAGLARAGVRAGDAVAVAFPNSLDFVVGAFAAFALDAILVPLNPRFKEDELRHYLQLSRPTALLYPPSMQALVDTLDVPSKARATSTEAVSVDEAGELAPSGSELLTGIYMFSSGSTGKSKRVTRTQAQVFGEYQALVETIGLQQSDRILCTVPLFHAHGFANAMMAALLSGGRLVMVTTEFNARATMQALTSQAVTIYPAVPFMFKMLADTRFATPPDLSALRLAFSAGAALPEAVSKKFYEVFAKPVSQLYGSTETGAISINVAQPVEKPTSVGRPLHGTRIEIRDESGARLGADANGEVWVAAGTATSAYDGLSEMTAECFADGAFFTGDLGTLDADGDLYITGRKKLLINVAGFKVDPLEVEEVLSRHAQVSEVVAIGVPHARAGEKIKAVVVLKESGAATQEELIEYAASQLAEYKVPKLIEFRAEIPKSPLGKVLRKYL
jgi:long-chain acyl-CoA synthetase